MSKAEESIDGMWKFNEKIYEDGITWLFGHHCLECEHLTFAQHEVKELAKYFYELGYQQAEKDMELSWEEIYSILYFEREVLREFGNEEHSNEEVCKEVLKRFKDYKERK